MSDFDAHIALYGLNFKTIEEYDLRKNIYDSLTVELEKVNSDPVNKNFRVSHNFLSTWTKEEKSKLRGFKHENLSYLNSDLKKAILPKLQTNELGLVDSFDWRDEDAVNAVKN